eukprot:Gb_07199 [translate_table: standard]
MGCGGHVMAPCGIITCPVQYAFCLGATRSQVHCVVATGHGGHAMAPWHRKRVLQRSLWNATPTIPLRDIMNILQNSPRPHEPKLQAIVNRRGRPGADQRYINVTVSNAVARIKDPIINTAGLILIMISVWQPRKREELGQVTRQHDQPTQNLCGSLILVGA